jgi:hypothetical protein
MRKIGTAAILVSLLAIGDAVFLGKKLHTPTAFELLSAAINHVWEIKVDFLRCKLESILEKLTSFLRRK